MKITDLFYYRQIVCDCKEFMQAVLDVEQKMSAITPFIPLLVCALVSVSKSLRITFWTHIYYILQREQ